MVEAGGADAEAMHSNYADNALPVRLRPVKRT
jgi:hypothetical protein